MYARSVFVVHTQIVGLSDRPFSLRKTDVRQALRPLLIGKNCFTDLRLSLRSPARSDYELEKPVPLPGKPFLRGLGQLAVRTTDDLAQYLAQRTDYWDPSAPRAAGTLSTPPESFGFDPTLADQRMFHLCFELDRPLFIRAIQDGRVQAQGHILVHIFPSGYATLLIAVALMPHNLASLNHVGRAVLETYPWNKQARWEWTGRLGNGRLEEIAGRVRQRLLDSVLAGRSTTQPAEHPWYPAVRISTDESVDELACGLLHGEVTTEQIGRRASFFSDASQFVTLHLSSQGLVCCLAADRPPRSARSFFWKVMQVVEFLRLKDQIYQDYADFLRPEIVRLRSYRLSMKQKMIKEEVLKLSVYDLNIPTYLLALDTYVRSLPPTWRYIYSLLSQRTHFSRRREQLKQTVQQWEAEVAQWEHGVAVLWKRVLSPLRSLFGL